MFILFLVVAIVHIEENLHTGGVSQNAYYCALSTQIGAKEGRSMRSNLSMPNGGHFLNAYSISTYLKAFIEAGLIG